MLIGVHLSARILRSNNRFFISRKGAKKQRRKD